VFWDNRATQQYAILDYWPQERIVERVTIQGDAPFYDAR
jgi:taurine dioxygenase